jgi:hypothetical protein
MVDVKSILPLTAAMAVFQLIVLRKPIDSAKDFID